MNDQAALEVQIANVPARAYVGERFPLVLLLKRPKGQDHALRVVNFACKDRDVQINTDMLERNVSVRPGETYCVTVSLEVWQARNLALDSLYFEIEGPEGPNFLLWLPPKQVAIQPALNQEIKVEIVPLCPYEVGTKVQITLENKGETRFRDLTISLEPFQLVYSGKRTLRLVAFNPGDREQMEAVVAGDELTLVMTALVEGQHVESRVPVKIPPLENREKKTFRFLEPRRLAQDQIQVFRMAPEGPRALPEGQAGYPLQGGEEYRINIIPQNSGVQSIDLKESPGQLQVNKIEEDPTKRRWTFLAEVSFNGLWSKPKRLFYQVESSGEKLTGEIHLRLKPPWGRYLIFALALGLAITAQGIIVLGKIILKADSPLDMFAGFEPGRDFQIFFLFVIPVLWIALRVFDRIQYRFRTE
jgi:hypothetical protein